MSATIFDRNRKGWLKSLSGLAVIAGVAAAVIAFDGLSATSVEAASRCKSQAADKKDAEDYCRGILKCEEKKPPEEMYCTGSSTARRWICRCRTPKSASTTPKPGFSIQFGVGVMPGMGGAPHGHPGGATEGGDFNALGR